jgi:intracellular sulfur oxidation DsrE/DsrF family protein
VNVAAVAEKSALDFLESQGHTAEEAHAILAAQGVDKVLAAKHTLGVKG